MTGSDRDSRGKSKGRFALGSRGVSEARARGRSGTCEPTRARLSSGDHSERQGKISATRIKIVSSGTIPVWIRVVSERLVDRIFIRPGKKERIISGVGRRETLSRQMP